MSTDHTSLEYKDYKRIQLAGKYRHIERPAGDDEMLPGMLVTIDSDDEFVKHSSSAGFVIPMFLVEDALQGNTVDDKYDEDEEASATIPARGAEVWALLSAGEDFERGDVVESNGDGTLKKGTTAPVGEIMDPTDLSASGAEDTKGRILVY